MEVVCVLCFFKTVKIFWASGETGFDGGRMRPRVAAAGLVSYTHITQTTRSTHHRYIPL